MELSDHEIAQIRVWPSLPDQPEIRWQFNDEKTLLLMQAERAVQYLDFTSDHINTLVHFLVARRKEMAGAPPFDPSELEDNDFFVADGFALKGAPFLQRAFVWGRVMGLGWVSVPIDAEVLLDAAQSLIADKPTDLSTSRH